MVFKDDFLTKEQAEAVSDFLDEQNENDPGMVPGDEVYVVRLSCDGAVTLSVLHTGTKRSLEMELVKGGYEIESEGGY